MAPRTRKKASRRRSKRKLPRSATRILNLHHKSFYDAKPFADSTGQLVPSDTKAWSQILVCTLTELQGRKREKGSDLEDGSDVKAANCWDAIDYPRFNGCLPTGRTSKKAKKSENVGALNDIPFLFFVLWDQRASDHRARCRIWCIRPPSDAAFRKMAKKWYRQRREGIVSANFQLHPPISTDENVFTNRCGDLEYPLLFCAVRSDKKYRVEVYAPAMLKRGVCRKAANNKGRAAAR
jgi:MamI restriction endonuclease